jgi:hypothetical protein
MASPLIATLRGEARRGNHVRDLRRGDETADADPPGQAGRHRGRGAPAGGGQGGEQVRGALGHRHARVHDGHVDPRRAQFIGEDLGQGGDGDVADRARWRGARAAGGQAADVDDPAPALGGHVRGDGPGAAQVADHLGVHRRPHRRVVGGVRGHGEHPAPPCGQPLARDRELARVAGQQGDVRPLGGERVGYGEADPAAAAGDDGPLAGQLQVHAGPDQSSAYWGSSAIRIRSSSRGKSA